MPTYNRADLAFERGEGSWLWTGDGRRFLDFGAGIATSSIGHGNKHLVQAIAEQAAKVMHTSNLYRIPQAERLAERLCATSFADSVFFGNSGAEANEGMIKAVRKYHAENGHPERCVTICFEGAFHGRTLATLAATGNEKYLAGFGPAMPGFKHVPFGNMNALRDAIDGTTAAVMIEPIQGEGGVRPASLDYLRDLRAACDEFGILLALDSTYGGNPLACAAGNAVLDVILAPGFLESVDKVARHFWRGLLDLAHRHPTVVEGVQGAGLLLGLKLRPEVNNGDMQGAAVAEGLLTVAAGMNVLRVAPPLTITEAEADEAIRLLDRACLRCTPGAEKAAAQ